jgi:argininosuccinate lyase
MTAKPGPIWGKHLSQDPDAVLVQFCAGRDVTPLPMADAELLPFDLWTNRAHAIMLHRQGILDRGALVAILEGLTELEEEWNSGRFVLDPAMEDVHVNVEQFLSQRKGEGVGGRLHTGRSRNDQVATDMRLFLRAACLDWGESLSALAETLLGQAEQHAETVMPGFTHMQPAMATTWGHWLSAHAQALGRDLERARLAFDLCNRSPLGAAAGFGTSWPIDRELTAELLAFERVEANTLDAIGSRWEHEWQAASAYAAAMAHLAVLAQDLILLSHPYWGLLRLDDRHVSGSSIMPQKRNPDFAEVIRGKSAWAAGMVTGLLAIPKGGMSGYNRDSQLTKYAVLDVVRECRAAPIVVKAVLERLVVNGEAMREKLGQGFLAATDLADTLARQLGLPFRGAYDLAAAAVRFSGDAGAVTEAATAQAFRAAGHPTEALRPILADLADPAHVVALRRHTGAPAPEAVRRQVAALREELRGLASFIPEQRERIDAAWRKCEEYPISGTTKTLDL